ncbi:SDR family oxidoreductase [Pontivivens ytuae]|uniref:SDR family oxidoreductase n=1 Tax=Pontivivens ytuae TaxID=2789856 RepID=A0A7S9LUT9_9RHOB|nr:SDR family oxidoreductase [Pontivivens ytuae]QPH55390.1 SDR family oxidoreductase [Pontivivens ytuae]
MAGIAVITGAGTGIGRAAAEALAAEGWTLALIGRRRGPLEEVANGRAASVHPADISDPEQVERAFADIAAEHSRVDLLFNNAGRGSPPRTIDETTLDDWFGVLGANLTGAFLCARAAFGIMRRQAPQGGRIINNGSISAHAPRPGSVPYTTTKHAMTGLTKSLSLDGRAFDIACGQIDIGNALTEMAQPMTQGVPQADGSIRAEATMDPAHVGRAVAQMAALPLDANVQFITIMARDMPYIGRG